MKYIYVFLGHDIAFACVRVALIGSGCGCSKA